MQAIGDYKYFGLFAFIILLVGLAFVVLKWPQDKRMTFSQHVAAHKQSIIYYVGLFSIALPLLSLFFVGWFMPTFHLPICFGILMIVSSITQYVCTLIPEIGGWRTDYHRFLSGVSGICLLPALVLILGSDFIAMNGKVAVIMGLLIMLGIIYILTRNKKEQHEPSFVHQSIYYAGFFLPILIASYF